MKKLEQLMNGGLSKIALGVLLAGGGVGVGTLAPWQEQAAPTGVLEEVRQNSAHRLTCQQSMDGLKRSLDRLNERLDRVIMAHHHGE